MSLNNAVVKTGASAIISATGGSDVTLKSLGDNTGRHELRFGGSSSADRNYLTFTARAPRPSLDNPSGYTQERTGYVLKIPREDEDTGVVTYDTLRVSMSTGVKTTDAQKKEMCYLGAQFIGQSDFDEFWQARDIN